jgi:6-phosphogluconate dehydrogenase
MQLGVIGLGRMGANIARRLHRAGHHCVVYNRTAKPVAELAAEGLTPASDILDLVKKLNAGIYRLARARIMRARVRR